MSKALICLDVQENFLGNRLDYIAPLCQRYLEDSGSEYEVIILTHWVDPDTKQPDGVLLSHPRAVVIEKRTFSALTQDVVGLLEEHHIEEVHLAGVDSELSVLATVFACVDAGYATKVLERLVSSYHDLSYEAMRIVKVVLGKEGVLTAGGQRVFL
ncbi:isochorismatase family protein [Alicyclobacillaceae bacterium I2511]|nr:isochorismatase family protein [Alicyclobacillaceae bacterium I2511]